MTDDALGYLHLPTLQTLLLADNYQLTGIGLRALNLPQLRVLCLCNIGYYSTDASRLISEGLLQANLPALAELDMNGVACGVHQMCAILSRFNQKLTRLDMSACNDATSTQDLVRALLEHGQKLSELALSEHLCSEQNLLTLASLSLTHIELFGDRVTDSSLRVLASSYHRLHQLRLLSAKHVTDKGVVMLLQTSGSLKELELEDVEQVSAITSVFADESLRLRGGSLI